MAQPKNIVLFFDGTWNEPQEKRYATENTNVRKLHLDCGGVLGRGQIVEYFKGIGTEVGLAPNLIYGFTGFGLTRNIKSGYYFMVRNYEVGDSIFLFGFSRGAFTARTLASLVGYTGILYSEEEDRLDDVLRIFIDGNDPGRERLKSYLRSLPFARNENRQPLPIHFIGVWDTVASMGIPSDLIPRRLRTLLKHWTASQSTMLPLHITHARHALALHELRTDFQPVLWEGFANGQSLEQKWFAGAHSDVGGGYYRGTTLSDIALAWIKRAAIECGLKTQTPALALKSSRVDKAGGIHVEAGKFCFTRKRTAVRQILRDRTGPEVAPPPADGSNVHESALTRLFKQGRLHYRPVARGIQNVTHGLHEVDERTLPMFVRRYFSHQIALYSSDPGNEEAFPWWSVSHIRIAGLTTEIEDAVCYGHRLPEGTAWVLAILFATGATDKVERLLAFFENRRAQIERASRAVVDKEDITTAKEWDSEYADQAAAVDATQKLLPAQNGSAFDELCRTRFPRLFYSVPNFASEVIQMRLHRRAPRNFTLRRELPPSAEEGD